MNEGMEQQVMEKEYSVKNATYLLQCNNAMYIFSSPSLQYNPYCLIVTTTYDVPLT